MMPFRNAPRSLLDRFWLPKWVPTLEIMTKIFWPAFWPAVRHAAEKHAGGQNVIKIFWPAHFGRHFGRLGVTLQRNDRGGQNVTKIGG